MAGKRMHIGRKTYGDKMENVCIWEGKRMGIDTPSLAISGFTAA